MSPRRIAAVAQKEWREIIRNRLFFALAFGVPVILMLLLGFGLTLDVANLPVAIVDHDGSAQSREYASHYLTSRYFQVRRFVQDERALGPSLLESGLRAVVVIPPRFGRDLLAGRPAHVQTLVDGTLPYRAQVVKGYVMALNAAVSAELEERWRAAATSTDAADARRPPTVEVRYLYNAETRSAWSFGPKLLMMILFMSAPFLTALGVVREKETGSIYNVFSSTVKRSEFLIGKLAPYTAIALINAVVLWLMATLLLGAPFRGSPAFLAGATLLYVLCSTGIGLLVSLVVDTQIASMFATAVLTMIPAQLYSGALIPLDSMSASGRAMARALPALYYHEIAVGVFLKGIGFADLWPELAVLTGYAVALWMAALALFSKRPRS